MESSGPSANASEPPSPSWARILGTIIAVLTLTLPLLVIAYYSSNNGQELLPKASYSMTRYGD